ATHPAFFILMTRNRGDAYDFVRGKGGRRAWVQQQANAKKHREEERVLRATKKKHRKEEMRTNLFIFEVGQVKAVLGCNEKMFLL
ncbi:MAG: hypothetical protein ACI3YW_05150, partial [Candidatus Egerieousia sp.]